MIGIIEKIPYRFVLVRIANGNFSLIEACSLWKWNFIPCRIGIYLESQSLKILAFTGLVS